MFKKIRSLIIYIKKFRNWWVPALARYASQLFPENVLLHLRDGRGLSFRPSSDSVAVGEIFVVGGYGDCQKLVEKPRIIWDIGGNIGGFTVWAAPIFPEADFVSFEPCEDTFAVLTKTHRANPRIRWTIHPFGLSCRDEVCEAWVPHGHYGQTSRFANEGQKITLNLRSIDEVWKEKGSPKIDLMKVDCEGGEYDIILGCSDSFLQAVGAIVMEIHTVKGKDVAQLNRRFRQAGFDFTPLDSPQGVIFARRS